MQDFFFQAAVLIALLVIFYAACATVQLTTVRPKTRYVVIGSFGTLAVLVGLLGILILSAPQVLNAEPAIAQQNARLYLIIALVTILPLVKSVRLLLQRFTPLDANSTVDISGVIAALWFLVLNGTYLFTVDLNTIQDQVRITVAQSVMNVIAFPALAFCLVGIWVVRSPREAIKRLGIEKLDGRQVSVALGLVLPLLILAVGIDGLGRQLQPERYAELENILKAMSSNVTNPAIALILGFCAGIGEEILFRGAIQPRLGIGFTALLFAASHTQYGFTFATIAILLVGIILGYQRKYMNTTACIITHGAYNTVVFLLSYFAGIGNGS